MKCPSSPKGAWGSVAGVSQVFLFFLCGGKKARSLLFGVVKGIFFSRRFIDKLFPECFFLSGFSFRFFFLPLILEVNLFPSASVFVYGSFDF